MFEDKIAASNKEETEMPLPYEKRIYTKGVLMNGLIMK